MLVFVCLLFCLLLIKLYLVVLYEPKSDSFNSELLADMEYVEFESDEKKTKKTIAHAPTSKVVTEQLPKKKFSSKNKNFKKRKALFEFDPNKLSVDSLMLLGFNAYAAKNVDKYRAKGGKFKNADDLRRIYGLDSILFEEIKPYVKITPSRKLIATKPAIEKPHSKSKPKPKRPKLAYKSIDINLADTTEFKKLKGIGSVYANRIVKFRNSLGGYFSVDQIREVWGISDSLYLSIIPYLAKASRIPNKKNLNSLDKKSLARHPYIDWKKAKIITSYRKMHGDFESIDDLRKMHGIGNAFVDTLAHYFVAE